MRTTKPTREQLTDAGGQYAPSIGDSTADHPLGVRRSRRDGVPPSRFAAIIEAPHQADDPTGARRVRMALKRLLRTHNLRAVEIRRAAPAATANPNPDLETPTQAGKFGSVGD
ncbi:MAG: hypothetical protein WD851_09335 [Pirellulales bacterium]